MKPYLQLLGLLLLALLGAWAWPYLAADPGYVLISFAGWSAEASLLAVVLLGVLAWLLLRWTLLLLRGPFRLLHRRRRAKARERLANAIVALQQGFPRRAEKLLQRAAGDPVQRSAALLCAADCARQRGDADAAQRYLLKLTDLDPSGIGVLAQARALLDAGAAERCLAVLEHGTDQGTAAPALLELRVRALAAAGRAVEALPLLPLLRRQRGREGQSIDALEAELAAAALLQSQDGAALDAVWNELPRSARGTQPVLVALAHAGHRLGQDALVAPELERALERRWDDALVALWGTLVHADPRRAIKRAEKWLAKWPDSSGLLWALGRLCHREQLWGKAEDFLQRAVSGRPAASWEALGALYVDRNDYPRAQQALQNALYSARGEDTAPVRALLTAPIEEPAVELRSSMGLPQLPAGRSG